MRESFFKFIESLDNCELYCKAVLPSSKSLGKYISGFSNGCGGHILLGVKKVANHYNLVGLSYDFNWKQVIDKAVRKLYPTPKIEVNLIEDFDKLILHIIVHDVSETIFYNGDKYIIEDNQLVKIEGEIIMDRSKVFIVHGHDTLAKTETARFIEKLGLEAVILHEQASSGNTIIEKIEENTNVGFGIVLYTPCDFGKSSKDSDLNPRARQNVVFEHGYLMGKIGRKNVCALVKSNVETPNDISGVVYVTMDAHGAWKLALIKELRNSGYDVDANFLL